MAQFRIKYYVVKPLAQGGYGHYFEPSPALAKKGWKPVNFGPSPMRDDPAKMELARAKEAEVDAWRAGGASPRKIKTFAQRHTFGSVVAAYRAHIDARVAEKGKPRHLRNPLVGKPMSTETRSTYFNKLETILIWGTTPKAAKLNPKEGDILVASITQVNVHKFRDALMTPDEDGHVAWPTAHSTLRVLRSMLAWAETQKIIPKGTNPAADFGLDTPPSRSTQWDEDGGTDDFDTFIAACEWLGCPSVALGVELGSWSSQRMGDILKLGRSHWKSIHLNDAALLDALRGDDDELKGFVLVQNKTDTAVGIPVVQPLRAKVEAAFARNLAMNPPQLTLLISERTGRPYDRYYFSDMVKEVRDFCVNPTPKAIAAGFVPRPQLANLWFMDLRRTRVCWLHDRGLDALAISMITGHSPKTVEEILKSTYRPRTNRGAAVAILAAHGPTARKAKDQQEKKA